MASINNLNKKADEVLQGAELEDTDIEGVKQFKVDDVTVFTSESNDVDLGRGNSDHAILRGNQNLGVKGNDHDNLIVDNDGDNVIDTGGGNDQVSSGNGNDEISLGDGDDTVELTGKGHKIVDGGAGNDHFIIKPGANGEGSDFKFTGLNRGDTVRISADANGDGQIDLNDVNGIENDADGNAVFTLKDGTTFTLEGVSADSALNGDITYTVFTDEDGNLVVELS